MVTGFALRRHVPLSDFPRDGLTEEPTVGELLRHVRGYVHFEPPVVWWVILSVAIALTVCVGMAMSFVLLQRLRKKTLWLVRWERGVFIPNTMMTFLLLEGVYMSVFILYLVMWYPVHLAGKVSTKPLGVFWVLTWQAMWAGGFWAAWGTLWSIPSDVVGRRTFLSKPGSASMCNSVFVAVHLVVFIPSSAFAGLFLREYMMGLDNLAAFEALCATQNGAFPASPELIAAGAEAWQAHVESLYWLGVSLWFWICVAWGHLLVYGVIGGLLIQRLSRHVKSRIELFKGALSQPAPVAPTSEEMLQERTFLPTIKPAKSFSSCTKADQLNLALRNVRVHYFAIMILVFIFSLVALGDAVVMQHQFLAGPDRALRSQLTVNLTLAIANAIASFAAIYAMFWQELEPVVFMWRATESQLASSNLGSSVVKSRGTGSAQGYTPRSTSDWTSRKGHSLTADSHSIGAIKSQLRGKPVSNRSRDTDVELQLLRPDSGEVFVISGATPRQPSTESFPGSVMHGQPVRPAEPSGAP